MADWRGGFRDYLDHGLRLGNFRIAMGHTMQWRRRPFSASGSICSHFFCKYTTRLLPINGLSRRSNDLVIHGFFMISHVSRRW